ncbi:hypothetical protein GCK32_021896, partial [Trichostrongylus colubriformis]
MPNHTFTNPAPLFQWVSSCTGPYSIFLAMICCTWSHPQRPRNFCCVVVSVLDEHADHISWVCALMTKIASRRRTRGAIST